MNSHGRMELMRSSKISLPDQMVQRSGQLVARRNGCCFGRLRARVDVSRGSAFHPLHEVRGPNLSISSKQLLVADEMLFSFAVAQQDVQRAFFTLRQDTFFILPWLSSMSSITILMTFSSALPTLVGSLATRTFVMDHWLMDLRAS